METVVLANHIKRTVAGPMWHGPALDELLKDVTAELAASRPVEGVHSIWELVLHVAAWAEISEARLRGDRMKAFKEIFPQKMKSTAAGI